MCICEGGFSTIVIINIQKWIPEDNIIMEKVSEGRIWGEKGKMCKKDDDELQGVMQYGSHEDVLLSTRSMHTQRLQLILKNISTLYPNDHL